MFSVFDRHFSRFYSFVPFLMLFLVSAMLLSGCQDQKVSYVPVVATDQQREAALLKWSRSCALCHVNGEAGAPVTADKQAWQPRLAQGQDVLMEHTLDGYNQMPPLGYCMDCTRTDFAILIEFMSGATAK